MRWLEQLHRVVGLAGEGEALTVVPVAAWFVGKAVVPDLEAERVCLDVLRSRAKREVGFGQTVPASRLRACDFEKGLQSCGVGRIEMRQWFGSLESSILILDEDMGMELAAVARMSHCRCSMNGDSNGRYQICEGAAPGCCTDGMRFFDNQYPVVVDQAVHSQKLRQV